MGCWDETCALTNTPIRCGSPCVMVLIERERRNRFYGPFGNSWLDFNKVKGIYKGYYNDYGWMKDKKGYGGNDIEVEGCDWNFKKYEDRPDEKFYIVFFHRNVWDACQKFHAENKQGNWNLEMPDRMEEINGEVKFSKHPEFSREFVVVCCIAHSTRRDLLAGVQFKGCQDWNTTETYKFVHRITANRLREKVRWEKRED